MNRRNFLKITGVASAGTMVPTSIASAKTSAMGSNKVYEATHAKMVTGTRAIPSAINHTYAKAAVDCLARKMGNNSDLGKAWEAIFPGIKKTDKIGIKVNCLKRETSPQLCTLEAMVNGMTAMFGGTYPAANIAIFDNDFALYGFNAAHVDNAFGKSALNKLGIWHARDTYRGPKIKIANNDFYVSTKWNEAKYCINFLCPRPHILFAGFLSGHIKNMMGAVSTMQNKFDTQRAESGGKFHDKSNFKAYVDMMGNPNIALKTFLYVSDFILVPNAENASYYDKIGKTVTFATNGVSVDSYVVDFLKKLFPSKATNKKVPQALAAANLGSLTYSKITVPVTISGIDSGKPTGHTQQRSVRNTGITAQPLWGHGYRFDIHPITEKGRSGVLRIVNAKGQTVRALPISSGIRSVVWDGKTRSGKAVVRGTYFLRAKGSTWSKVGKFVIS